MKQVRATVDFLKTGALAAVLCALLFAAPRVVSAEPILAVTTANALLRFDSATPGTTSSVAISGVGGDQILGIDFRPATGQLYGIGSGSNLYTIDTITGNATLVGMLGTPLSGASFGADFNPTVDRFRLTSDAEQNLRVNPASPGGAGTIVDGMLAYDATDPNSGVNPNVVGSAYTNNFNGATTTTLYGIDSSLNTLVTQNPANAGTLFTIGSLGQDPTALLGFDISGRTGIAYAAWATAGGPSALYTINLSSGAASLVGLISTPAGQQVRGLAAPVPEPAVLGLLGMGVVMLIRRRRSATVAVR